MACAEQGLRDAIAAGGGPFTFDCEGPTTVVTEDTITIDSDVILDGEGNLTLDGNEHHPIFWLGIPSVADGVKAELRGFKLTRAASSAIRNQGGTMSLVDTIVSDNVGGGIVNETTRFSPATLTLLDSVVSDNVGGGVRNHGGTLIMINSIVSGNTESPTALTGGGILNEGTATLTNCTVSENTAGYGGGIINGVGGVLTLSNSSVSGNIGRKCFDGLCGGGAGGVHNDGRLTVINSTVSGNASTQIGGGIVNGGTASLRNSTVSENTANDRSGGIRNNGTLTLINSTVSGNWAPEGSDIDNVVIDSNVGQLTMTNSLVDGDCGGPIISGSGNLESPGDTCGFDQPTDQVSVSADDLRLGELADNGGPTMTHALLPGSVAIDQIPQVDCVDADGAPLTTDQRGEARPETGGTMCDVGAFELQP